jgi:ComF family protein
VCQTAGNGPAGQREAVFSSSEDQIRASRATAQSAGPSIVFRGTDSSRNDLFSNDLHGSFSLRKSLAPQTSLLSGWAGFTLEGLFAVMFPSNCRICSDPLTRISRLPVCQQCLDGIHPIRGRLCDVCGERVLASATGAIADEPFQCPLCRRAAPPFAKAVAYGSYEGGLRDMIHLLKYSGIFPAANVLGRMLAEVTAALEPFLGDGTVLVIPVPLHKSKRRERRFNQAELIAGAAVKALGSSRLQLANNILQRRRDTQSQIGMTIHQRRENMRGAFAVARAQEVKDKEVLLVDDVLTTGATASECARVLLRAGASGVWVATVARTLKLASNENRLQSFKVAEDRFQGLEVAEFQGSNSA